MDERVDVSVRGTAVIDAMAPTITGGAKLYQWTMPPTSLRFSQPPSLTAIQPSVRLARMQRGALRRGPARLACHDGSVHGVTVLGFGMVSPPPSDPMLLDLLLDLAGAPQATIAPGQQVLQDDPDDE